MESHETPELKAVAKEERKLDLGPAFKDMEIGQAYAAPPEPPPANLVKVEKAGAMILPKKAEAAPSPWKKFDFSKELEPSNPADLLSYSLQAMAEGGVDKGVVRLSALPLMYFGRGGKELMAKLLDGEGRDGAIDSILAAQAVRSEMLSQLATSVLSTEMAGQELIDAVKNPRSHLWMASKLLQESDKGTRSAIAALRRLKGPPQVSGGGITVQKAMNVQIAAPQLAHQPDGKQQSDDGKQKPMEKPLRVGTAEDGAR